jgi:hypothetical protein
LAVRFIEQAAFSQFQEGLEMKVILKCLVVLVIGIILGVGSAVGVLHFPTRGFVEKNGAWAANLDVGSQDAGMYLRAYVARVGLFALNKTETIYYTAWTDNEGQSLRSNCDYRIEGGDIPTRWWSITLYGEDSFLVPNQQDFYSFNMNNIERDEKGSYKVLVSSTEKSGTWLPSGDKDQDISLTLRCYNPEPILYESPDKIELPRVIKEGCK